MADDNKEFLANRQEDLEDAGFTVIPASNPEDASRILERGDVHLAILDMRLRDDNDPLDKTGLELAMKFGQGAVPIIMLTGFPDWNDAKASLVEDIKGLSPAVDYLSKDEGPEAMIQAVIWALENPKFRQIILDEFQVKSSQDLYHALKEQQPFETMKDIRMSMERVWVESLQEGAENSEQSEKYQKTAIGMGSIVICMIIVGTLLFTFRFIPLPDLSDAVSIAFAALSIVFEILSILFINRGIRAHKHVKMVYEKEQKSYHSSHTNIH